jgi:hypothetical protein
MAAAVFKIIIEAETEVGITITLLSFMGGAMIFTIVDIIAAGLLLQISVELIDQLHINTNNDRYLLRRATERAISFCNWFYRSFPTPT